MFHFILKNPLRLSEHPQTSFFGERSVNSNMYFRKKDKASSILFILSEEAWIRLLIQ